MVRVLSRLRPEAFIAMLTLTGCATHEAKTNLSAVPHCTSVACMHMAAKAPLYEACMSNLSKRRYSHREQRAIVAEYRYPFTNSDGYSDWIRLGGRGPTPRDWCRGYADRKYGSMSGLSMSIR